MHMVVQWMVCTRCVTNTFNAPPKPQIYIIVVDCSHCGPPLHVIFSAIMINVFTNIALEACVAILNKLV